jgi:hypothetical protein
LHFILFAGRIAYLVVQVVHQPALLDRQDLVEGTRDVESYGGNVLQTFAFFLRQTLNLFAGEIALVGTAEIQLVAVFLCLFGAEDGLALWEFHLADARQLIHHLRLLHAELFGVGELLPFAAAARAEVLAHRLLAYLAELDKPVHFGIPVVVLLADDAQINHVARDAERYEDDHA